MSDEFGGGGDRPLGAFATSVERILGFAASCVLFLLMTATLVDVVGRYVFNAPLPAGYEMIQIGMALLVFLVLPIVTARDEQVRIDIFQALFPARLRPFVRLASQVVSLIVIAGFAWFLVQRAGTFAASGETTSNLRVPLAPLAMFVAVAWAVAGVIVAVRIVRWRAKGGAA